MTRDGEVKQRQHFYHHGDTPGFFKCDALTSVTLWSLYSALDALMPPAQNVAHRTSATELVPVMTTHAPSSY